ncbi:Flp family type IVb pilin [Marinobacterium stanieri]|uniref:Pilus assembly protein Flp/PilA n=1 Tax=Marinobacterium stanieri TaxID=49186 RepID=A0A1N6NJI8_9GAMM|nr:pilus assembly protein [Marinobacterium stanieri]SIP92240.1 pilus assembly protein Flp/PilA [Marinobacterium stanieri]
MNLITQKILDFIQDEEGLTTVEYAVAGSLVAATVVVAFTDLGEAVETVIDGLTTAISS